MKIPRPHLPRRLTIAAALERARQAGYDDGYDDGCRVRPEGTVTSLDSRRRPLASGSPAKQFGEQLHIGG